MFTNCPKCGYAPLPKDQAFPAACPACNLVLSKFGSSYARRDPEIARRLAGERDERPDTLMGRTLDLFLHVPDQVSRLNWQGRIALLVLFSLWSFWILKDYDLKGGDAGSSFLHLVLTPFHEAGHYAIFRWFGRFIMVLGGTLGQHLMPIVLGIALLVKRGDPFGAAVCFWLLGFSVADMGIYMYDAYDPQLMLLDGKTGAESDGHDWQNIFGDLGMLKRARSIGRFWSWIGAFMMIAGLVWAGLMIWLQRERLSDSVFAEANND